MTDGQVPTGSPTNLGGRGVYNLGRGEFRRCGDKTTPAYGPQPGGGHTAKVTPIPLLSPGDPGFGRLLGGNRGGGGGEREQGGIGFNLLDLLKGLIGIPLGLFGLGGGGGGGGGQAGIDPSLPYMPGDPYSQMPAGTGDPAAVRRMREGEPPLWQRTR